MPLTIDDFAIDDFEKLQSVLQQRELGYQLELVDPDRQTVALYGANTQPIILKTDDKLTIPDLLPGWEITVSDLWFPYFCRRG
jgi:hypothetical protein